MKVYARTKRIHDENCLPVPYNVNIANAIEGFHDMGFEIHCYEKLSEAYNLYQQGDIVLDGILQVNHCLNKFGIVSDNTDYPDVLLIMLSKILAHGKVDQMHVVLILGLQRTEEHY